jgi:N-acetylglucosaminyldiphosphoundecaprenol N-acetyl-beta-D-mannosaminyltransferase
MTQTADDIRLKTTPASRLSFLGSPVDSLSMEDAIVRIQEFIDLRSPHLVVAINVPKLWRMQGDERLKHIVETADLILPEQVITLASRFCKDPLKACIGNDRLTQALLPLAAKRGIRLFFLGSRPSVLEQMLARLRRQHPEIIIAGWHHGYFMQAEMDEISAEIRACQPDVLFVGMGTPKQEYWMDSYGRSLGVPVVIGVGGTLEVLAGIKHECPDWIRILGFAWIFRLIEDPSGKLRRYSVALPWFIRALLTKGILPCWFSRDNGAKN